MDPVSKIRAACAENRKKPAHLWKKGQSGCPERVFKPGQSGNPGGRPKKKPITQIYEELYSDPAAREAIKAAVLRTMSEKGMAGVLERRESADRLEGKVTLPVEAAVNLLDLSDEELRSQLTKLLSND